MKQLKRGIASVLAVLMLFTLLPLTALAEEPTGTPGTDETGGESAVVSETDQEEPADSEKQTEPEESSEAEEPAEPEETTEPEETDVSSGWFSLLPLEEHSFTVDFTDKLPSELKAVPVKEIFAHCSEKDADGNPKYSIKDTDKVSWSASAYSESDNFETIDATGTIDLTAGSSDRVTLTLIVGTADQLDRDNIRYIVTVKKSPIGDDFLVFDAVTEDRQKIEVYNHRSYYYSYGRYVEGKYRKEYSVRTPSNQHKYGDSIYLSMQLNENLKERGLTGEIYEGYFSAKEQITGEPIKEIWEQDDLTKAGGYQGTYRYTPFTLVLKREKTIVEVIPFELDVWPIGMSLSTQGLYKDGESDSQSRTNAASSSRYKTIDGTSVLVYKLRRGYSADEEYYVGLEMVNPKDETISDYGKQYVTSAYKGKFETEEDAAAVKAENIKDQLFSSAYKDGAYKAKFNEIVTFTVFAKENISTPDSTVPGLPTPGIPDSESPEPDDPESNLPTPYYISIKVEEDTTPAPEPEPEKPNAGTSLDVYRVESADEQRWIKNFEVPNSADSYYANGFQTLFLMNSDGTPVTEKEVIPYFRNSSKGKVFLKGENGTSGTVQESGNSKVPFKSGEALHYTVGAEDNEHAENYWVTLLTPQTGGAKLYVNGTNVDSWKQDNMPIREIFLNENYDGAQHDILIANIGDAPLTGLKVTLENGQNVKLDSYWNVQETSAKTLAPFDKNFTDNLTEDGNWQPDRARNIAKIRLLPDGNGTISGVLKISADGQEPVSIKLTGLAGEPQFETKTVVDGVKWVPYSSMIQTNYMHGNQVKFTLKSGELPKGLELKPNGEIYGVPQETGAKEFTVLAEISDRSTSGRELKWSISKAFTLTIKDNTNQNVWEATDTGEGADDYSVTVAIPNADGSVSIQEMDKGDNSWDNETQVFLSQGQFAEFQALWLDGVKLEEGEDKDYNKEEGSTRLTIRTQTLRDKGNGTHTLSMEFRNPKQELKRSAQNYAITPPATDSNQTGTPGIVTPPAEQPTEPDTPVIPDVPTEPIYKPSTPATTENLARDNWTAATTTNGAPAFKHTEDDGTVSTGVRCLETSDGVTMRYIFNNDGIVIMNKNTIAADSGAKICNDGGILLNGNLYYLNPNRDESDPRTCYVVTDYLRVRANYAGQTYYDQDGITFVGWMKTPNGGLRYQTRIPQPNQTNDLYLIVWRIQELPACQHPDYPGDASHMLPAGRYFFDDDGILVQKEGWNDGKDGKEYYTNANGMVTLERAKQ